MLRNVCFNVLFIMIYSKNILHSASSAKLPEFLRPCNRNAPDLDKCISATIVKLQPKLGVGIPEMQLVPLDPLFVPKAEAHTGNLDAYFQDMNLYRTNAFSVEHFHFDLSNNMLSADVLHPTIRQTGLYSVKGKLLFIELESNGHFEANFSQIHTTLKIQGRRLHKNGKEHIKFETIVSKVLGIDDFHIQLDNLFPNSVDLTKTTNDAINENRNALLPDFLNLLEETISMVVLSIVNTTFDRFSIDELIPDN